jgi:hypothetical protein
MSAPDPMAAEPDDVFWRRLLGDDDPCAPGKDWAAAAFGQPDDDVAVDEPADIAVERNDAGMTSSGQPAEEQTGLPRARDCRRHPRLRLARCPTGRRTPGGWGSRAVADPQPGDGTHDLFRLPDSMVAQASTRPGVPMTPVDWDAGRHSDETEEDD